MKTKKILLARPNTWLVAPMQNLIEEIRFEPTVIHNIKDIHSIEKDEVAAIVISTAVDSEVKESYIEVLKMINQKFVGKPIFLATLMGYESLKKNLAVMLLRNGLDFNILSIQEAIGKPSTNPHKDLIVITKQDIVNADLLKATTQVTLKVLSAGNN